MSLLVLWFLWLVIVGHCTVMSEMTEVRELSTHTV